MNQDTYYDKLSDEMETMMAANKDKLEKALLYTTNKIKDLSNILIKAPFNCDLIRDAIILSDIETRLQVYRFAIQYKDSNTAILGIGSHGFAMGTVYEGLNELDSVLEDIYNIIEKNSNKWFPSFRNISWSVYINKLNKCVSILKNRGELMLQILACPEDIKNNNIGSDERPIETEYTREQRRLQQKMARQDYLIIQNNIKHP